MQIPRVAIIGFGFAGQSAYQILKKFKSIQLIVIDKKLENIFLPLLPEVLSKAIELEYITYNIDTCLRNENCIFVEEAVYAVDPVRKTIATQHKIYNFDYLLIAAGSEVNFYNNPALVSRAYSLTEPASLVELRNNLQQEGYENIVVAGGGYTGVEIATHVKRLIKTLDKELTITIVEYADDLLKPMPRWIKDYVYRELAALGIKYLLNHQVKNIQDHKIELSNGEVIEKAILIWSAGVITPDFVQKIDVPKDKLGRLITDEYLKINDSIFVVGDCAAYKWRGDYLRMAVRFAIDEARLAAKNILQDLNRQPLKKFKPFDPGYLIPLSGNKACGYVFNFRIKGYLGILLHYLICFVYSHGLKNRWAVLVRLLLQMKK